MNTTTKRISDRALTVLSALEIENLGQTGCIARIEVQLDRKSYNEVNDVLTKLEGEWNRKAKGHVFNCDASTLASRLESVLTAGAIVDEKKLFQFFETPNDLADTVVTLALIKDRMSVLEPSAGRGALLHALHRARRRPAHVVAIELDQKHTESLNNIINTIGVVSGALVETRIGVDFLTMGDPRGPAGFDRIVMNPPFRAQQDAKHVLHAYSMLAPGGRLVAIMSAAIRFRETKHYDRVRELTTKIIPNPPGSFSAMGTEVETCTVIIERA